MPSTTVEIRGKDNTKRAFGSVKNSADRLKTSMIGLGGAMKAFGVLAAAALVLGGKKMLDFSDRIGKVSSAVGVSVEKLQHLQFAAEQSGSSTEGLNKAVLKLSKNIGEALTNETSAQMEAFNGLNISLRDVSGRVRGVDEVIIMMAESLNKSGGSATDMKYVMDLLGRSGSDLIGMLRGGAQGVDGMRMQLESMNGVLGEDSIKASEKFNDNLNLISKKGRGLWSGMIKGLNDFVGLFLWKQNLMLKPIEEQIIQYEKLKKIEIKRILDLQAQKKEMNAINVFGKKRADINIAIHRKQRDEYKSTIKGLHEQLKLNKKNVLENERSLKIQKESASIAKSESSARLMLEEEKKLVEELNIEYLKKDQEHIEREMMKQEELKTIRDAAALDELTTFTQLNAAKKKAEADRLKKLKEDADKKLKEDKQNAKDSLKVVESLSSGIKDESYEIFMAWKASAIANATIATYEAATKAYSVPYVGIALAGLIYGLGMANVAKIGATKYEGRQYGGPVEGGRSYMVGEAGPELLTMGRNSGYVTPNNQLARPINVNINAIDAEGIDDLLYERRGMLVGIINESLAQETRAEI